ncbi:hypothetical protein ETX26_10880 [Pelagerythrobacter rhizovicinus]|uniref:DUF4129 domain-containing protein n=1 Tax=Pelagerythrobacter rhizovicinus TaxID=2268576 RepID=A0A4Q2KNH8_9SPHN|nr:hypothetical protein ETX26_10880 [Pelagerythrobacter rhizovicinus]
MAEGGTEPAGTSWDAVRADDTIQFTPIDLPERQEPPGWLTALLEALGDFFAPIGRALGMSWPVFKWVLLAIGVLLAGYLLWRLLAPALARRKRPADEEQAWAPDRAEALALLEDADRLAAEGRYDEATRLLLQRSVGQIAAARPDWVEPSSTARELAALTALPEAARTAFTAIAERVERSLFALRSLGAEDWQAARAAYAEFALQRLPGRTA